MSSSMEKVHKLLFTRQNFPEHAKQTLASMLEDSKKGLFCDVNLVSGLDGKKIAAHRSVLSNVNDFFRTMFLSAFKEAENKDIVLSDISTDILESLISYCYTGIIDINEYNVQLLLPQAQLMLFPEIVEACSNFLQSQFSPTNCIGIFQYAKLYNCNRLSKNVEEYMLENFLNVFVSQEFLQLNEEEVEAYLSNVKLNVNSEKEVFEALMRWVNYDQDSRIPSLSKLLCVIRLHQLETSFLLEYIANNSDNQSNLLAFAKGVKQNLSNAQALPERIGPKQQLLVFVYQEKIAIYNPLTSTIDSEYNFAPDSYTPTLLDQKLILVGENEVQSFDLKTETWEELAATQTKRFCHAVATLNDYVYVIGGTNDNTVERWDAKSEKWTYVESMHQKRESPCTAVLNGNLYVMGGKSSNSEYLNTVECYNPHTNKWSFCNSMLEKKASAKAIVANGEIYVFGGTTSSSMSCIEKYNSETDTWTKVSEMNEKRHTMAACAYDKKIILYGGRDYNNKVLTSMEEYDPITNKCKLIPTAFDKYDYEIDMFLYRK